MLGWKCSRVPAGGCERRVPAGERSDPAGSSSAQPGLAEAERQERGRQGCWRERGEEGGELGNSAQLWPTDTTTTGIQGLQSEETGKMWVGFKWHAEEVL